jgi:hypothetical protein
VSQNYLIIEAVCVDSQSESIICDTVETKVARDVSNPIMLMKGKKFMYLISLYGRIAVDIYLCIGT